MLILVDWSQLVKLLLNESNQHRILSTGGAGSLEEQRAVYWMHARWGKEMPVKWERTKVLQRFAFGIQTCSSSMRYYRVKPERQSIAWVCCTSGNVWYNVVMLSSVVQCRLVSRVLNCCQCGLWCFQCFQRDLFSLVPSDANTFTLSSRNRIPAHNHLSTAQLSLHVEHNPRSGQLTTLLMIQIRIYWTQLKPTRCHNWWNTSHHPTYYLIVAKNVKTHHRVSI